MPEECRVMQGNAGECQGNVRELVQCARGMQGMPGERMEVGQKGQGNAGEYQLNA